MGYIGRHVPRKRPELPIIAMNRYGEDTKVVNMGMTSNNKFWNKQSLLKFIKSRLINKIKSPHKGINFYDTYKIDYEKYETD